MNTLTKTEERPVSGNSNGRTSAFITPLANIRETKEGYHLEVEMPGVGKDGLEITSENNQLTISGRRTAEAVKGEVVYRESRPLNFRRVFDLDPSIDVARINARMEQGVLKLLLPKAESVKPRRIVVTE